jgi:sodium/bile acid cotransporter 7
MKLATVAGRIKQELDWFLIGMFAAVILAILVPDPGAEGGILYPEVLTKAGVALIFFLHGISLPLAALKAGTLRWPLHLVVQCSTFLLFPLLGIGLLTLVGPWLAPDLRVGFFFLCALPSTVSSSVAMTAAAGGNVPAAVFNATLSSLIGVVITPLWMGWMIQEGGGSIPVGEVILDLLTWLVLPLFVGQFLRPWLGVWVGRYKKKIHVVDRLTILLLVYTSFCDSVKWGVWSQHGWSMIGTTFVGSAALFAAALWIVSAVCDALRFPPGDRSAAIFCGSKKTLASGVPMARIMFGTHPGIGLILLPIMIYHPLQLVVSGVLAGRWASQMREHESGPDSLNAEPDLSVKEGLATSTVEPLQSSSFQANGLP